MLAIASLHNDYLVLSDLLADPRTSIPDGIDTCVPDVNVAEWNISKVFAYEFRFHDFMYRQWKELAATGWQPPDSPESRTSRWFVRNIWGPVLNWFFKFNATENRDAQLMTAAAQLASMNPAAFEAQRTRRRDGQGQHDSTARAIYNPVGMSMLDIAVPDFDDYVLRAYDVAAVQRLVRLSLEIRRRQVGYADTNAFMKQHPEWSTHPADGSAFMWNANAGEISIRTVATWPTDRRFAVRIWKKPAD
jgi:hypothetical protein